MHTLFARTTAAAALAASVAALAPVVAPAASASPATARGRLVDATPVAALSTDDLNAVLSQMSWDTSHVRYAVTGYRLRYRTIDPAGRPTVASGLVMLPTGDTHRLSAVVWEHGTTAARDAVASMTAGGGDREAAELFASAGYLSVAPDYLGLGTGAGPHPYMDNAAEVTASQDMLRAAATFAARRGAKLDGTVRITGFSQGGAATMALARAVPAPWRLTAAAPISGPYDLENTEIPALASDPGDGPGQIDPMSGTFYIAYWTVAMNRLYHLYSSPSQVFRSPYDATVPTLFDGYHDEESIVSNLPDSPDQLLTPSYLDRLRHPSGALLRAIRDNDGTCQWRSTAPIRLYAADGDRDVPIGNATACRKQLASHRTHAPLVDVGDTDHTGSAIRSVPLVLDWFTSLD